MNYPIQIGFAQGVPVFIGLVGLGLIIWSFAGLFRRGKNRVLLEDDYGNKYPRYIRRRRHFKWGSAAIGLVMLIIGGFFLGIAFMIQEYIGFNSKIPVAEISASPIANAGPVPMMDIELKILDQSGNATSDQHYQAKGDEWIIYGDILQFHPLLNFFGLHAGYKLTRLEGIYSDPNLEANEKHTVIVLNGGDGDFFKTVYKQAWSSPFVTAAQGSGAYEPADGMWYNICVSNDAIVSQPQTKPC